MGRLAGTIGERRAAHDNPTVLIGGGDQLSPSSLSPVSNWTVPVEALNRIGPAAEVVGNHDLDFGFDPVENYSAASEFPWLLANVVTDDGETVPGTQNYTVVERDGVRVGVVGLVDDAIKTKTAVDFEAAGYDVADFSTVGQRIAADLKADHDVDVVVAAAHVGVPESKELASETDAIDVIVTGDDEVEYPPQVTDGAVITEAAGNAAFVGELNLTVGEDGVAFDDGRLLGVGEDSPVDEGVRSYVNDSRGRFLSTVAGETTVALNSTFGNYNEETRWGNLVTDAFRAKSGADVALTNAGGIRGGFVFGPGEVTYDDIYTSLPFGNTLVTKELDGAELRQLLASQVTTLESDDGQRYGAQAALQVSGVTYEYVPHENATRQVRDVHVNGDPVGDNETYDVTLNSYMSGWSVFDYNWTMTEQPTVSEDLTLYGTAAVEYVENNTPVSPERDGHIQRVDATGEASTAVYGETLTVDVTAPDGFDGLNGSVWLRAPGGDRIAPVDARYEGGDTVTVEFDRADAAALVDTTNATALELYAEYDSTRYELVYHDHARLNADVSVAALNGQPSLPGTGNHAVDTDGDGRFEDIDGDGATDLFDALTYFQYGDSDAVQDNVAAFDFDGDGDAGDLFDALALFEEISG
ncbi:bifunctional UDP-sugar hydrolase/5'-nucleotidase [Halapricum sp. CBA1109]|uniref:bifunctional metallophosphatase/5'-nucleotidase n=1 Tax=Halapricum sp. CBA1109 TaxID=2668068 RepID=UPI0018D24086|nr:bifunctional metallophosphatase/5'-nucleotidase [Halapricum sp. CBA1109]